MNNNNFFNSADDDMEYLPIIPLNEDIIETTEDQSFPNEIPLIALKNTVLFPGVAIPITVGRDKSMKAVTDANKGDKLIGVVSQKDSVVEDPTVSDLANIGTIAKIVKLIKMPDGGTTVIIQGKRRFKVDEITSEDPYFKAKIIPLNDELVNKIRILM